MAAQVAASPRARAPSAENATHWTAPERKALLLGVLFFDSDCDAVSQLLPGKPVSAARWRARTRRGPHRMLRRFTHKTPADSPRRC